MSVPEGWYADPARPIFERWWTGTEWTEEFRHKSASKTFWTAMHPEQDSTYPPYPPPAIDYPSDDEEPDDLILPPTVGLTGSTVRSSVLRGILIGIPLPSRRAMRRTTARYNVSSSAKRTGASINPTTQPIAAPPPVQMGASDSEEGESTAGEAPAGWYVDPSRPLYERWWTGTEWSGESRPRSASKSFWEAREESE